MICICKTYKTYRLKIFSQVLDYKYKTQTHIRTERERIWGERTHLNSPAPQLVRPGSCCLGHHQTITTTTTATNATWKKKKNRSPKFRFEQREKRDGFKDDGKGLIHSVTHGVIHDMTLDMIWSEMREKGMRERGALVKEGSNGRERQMSWKFEIKKKY